MAHISTMEKLGIPAPGFSLPNLNAVVKEQTVSLETFEESLFVKDVQINDDIDVNDDVERLVARVMPPRVEEEITDTEEDSIDAAEVPVVEGESESEAEE